MHAQTTELPEQTRPRSEAGSIVLGSLYVSTAVMQGLDVHSTLRGLRSGAAEANPMMKGIVKNPALFIATKAAVGYGAIMASRKMAKKSKIAAVVALAAMNTLVGVVVHHNYQVLRRMR